MAAEAEKERERWGEEGIEGRGRSREEGEGSRGRNC